MSSLRRFGFGLFVTIACAALLLRLIPWSSTRTALESADPVFIGLAVTCLVASLIAKTVRWRLLLPDASDVSTPRLYRILHISFLLNNVLPARLGDVARVAMTSRQPGVRFGHVLSSLLTERVTDAATLLAGFLIVSPFLPVPARYEPLLRLAWVVIAAIVLLSLLATLFRNRIGKLAQSERIVSLVPGNARLREEAKSFSEGFRQLFSRRHVISIWGWSWGAWIGAFAINYLLMQACHIDAPVAVAVLLTCTTNLAMLIPSSPGYVGVFHAAATLSLLPFHVASGTALSFAILAHLVNVVPVSLIGAAFLLFGREQISFNLGSLRRQQAAIEAETHHSVGG
ncbi:MAG: lysylphosphatidylglycerol synthase transmembrane domain-containing protein [bacterium]